MYEFYLLSGIYTHIRFNWITKGSTKINKCNNIKIKHDVN